MKKNIIIVIAILALVSSSCSDSFLDETPKSSYTPETLADAAGIEASLVGIHNVFSYLWSQANSQGWLCCWQVGTDVATPGQPQGIEVPYYQYGKLTSDDGAASFMWDRCYKIINNANVVIKMTQSQSTSLNDAAKEKAEGEAKFFRAYAYNYLATLFGGVPLVETPVTTAKTDYVRASLDDVNKLIVSDLTYAAKYLPSIDDVPSNDGGKMYGRANKYMAMQLLGEVYLRMGKPELAIDPLDSIIVSGKFSLIKQRYGIKAGEAGDCFHDMFIMGNQRRSQGNTETIWTYEIESTKSVTDGYTGNPQQRRVWVAAYYNYSSDLQLCDSLGGRGLARLRLSSWVTRHLYQDGDMRNSKYNIHRDFYGNIPESTNYGKLITPRVATDTIYKLCPYTTKWNCFDPDDTFGYAAIKDWELMRLGETYLLLAEAYQQSNQPQKAADAINELRKRAFSDYPNKGKVEASDITLDFILDERARELIGEENRRMTLMRTKTLVERAKLNTDACAPITGLKETNMLLPIPLTEIQLNKDAVLEQNPGYTN